MPIPTLTELAPMSTTSDVTVAAHYGTGSQSLLFKVTAKSFMAHGANLQWLSAFPAEAEVLYPPLTYLHPTGRTERVTVGKNSFVVVEVEPSMS